jgi:hypothetical protein
MKNIKICINTITLRISLATLAQRLQCSYNESGVTGNTSYILPSVLLPQAAGLMNEPKMFSFITIFNLRNKEKVRRH